MASLGCRYAYMCGRELRAHLTSHEIVLKFYFGVYVFPRDF